MSKKPTNTSTEKKKKLSLEKEKKPSVENINKLPPEIKESKIELFTRQSDELAETEAKKRKERQKQKIQFIGGGEIDLADYLLDVMAKHKTKFYKDWFYRLADVYGVNRKLMDTYVKPNFVRLFIIQFIYGRFPYLLLRTLRSRNRKLNGKGGKLFQHLKDDKRDKLDGVIKDAYDLMEGCENNPLGFKMKYSKEYKLYFQVEMF